MEKFKIHQDVKIAIIDDQISQNNILIDSLHGKGLEDSDDRTRYKVFPFSVITEFYDFVKKNIVQFVLIDIDFSGSTKGFDIAKECKIICPEAVRLCISRDEIVKRSSKQVVESLNIGDDDKRLFYAFGDKFKQNEIRLLVDRIRKKQVLNDDVEIIIDKNLNSLINSDFDILIQKEEIFDVASIFIEIIKKTAYNKFFKKTNKIELSQIGKGRSRTIVFLLQVYYDEEKIPQNNVVKIGFPDTINQEVNNYGVYVPSLLFHGYYPSFENNSECRQLSSLSYRKLGNGKMQQLPPTLRDILINDEIIRPDNIVNDIFKAFIPENIEKIPSPRLSLFEAYSERYRTLKELDTLDKIYKLSLNHLFDLDLGEYTKNNDSILLTQNSNKKIRTSIREVLNGSNIAFDGYMERVVHGDLHLDNIIKSDNTKDDSTFYIDFAHSKPNHCYLDHLVLEFGVRFQLMEKYILELKDTKSESQIITSLIDFEMALLSATSKYKKMPKDFSLHKYYNLISSIRLNAHYLFKFEDEYRYFGGFGLLLCSGLRLPINKSLTSENVDFLKTILRVWFSVGTYLNLERFDKLFKNKESFSLNIYSNQNNDDIILNFIEDRKIEILKDIKQVSTTLDEVTKFIKINNELLEDIQISLKSEFPKSFIQLESIIKESSSDYSGGFSLGLPFFMVQLNKKINLPPKLADKIQKLENKLNNN